MIGCSFSISCNVLHKSIVNFEKARLLTYSSVSFTRYQCCNTTCLRSRWYMYSCLLSFVQFQRELPAPPVSFRSVPEETLSFLLNTTCHLLVLGAACCSEQILYWFPDSDLDSDWITDTFVVTCCQMSADCK